jgi:hypothetical protein
MWKLRDKVAKTGLTNLLITSFTSDSVYQGLNITRKTGNECYPLKSLNRFGNTGECTGGYNTGECTDGSHHMPQATNRENRNRKMTQN